MKNLFGWMCAVCKHWLGWVGGTSVAFILYIVENLMRWQLSPWHYVGLLLLGLFYSMFAAWKDEHTAKEIAEKAVYNGRPLFVLNVVKQPSWNTRTPLGETIFTLQNCGARPARWVSCGQQSSKGKYYSISFAEIPALNAGETLPLAFAIDNHGPDQRMLCEFLENNQSGVALVWWDIPITFRDADESVAVDLVRLCFDAQSHTLYSTGVPYTAKTSKPQQAFN